MAWFSSSSCSRRSGGGGGGGATGGEDDYSGYTDGLGERYEFVQYVVDPEWKGVDDLTNRMCQLQQASVKWVALEGTDIGCRFLGCPYVDVSRRCGFTEWRDPEHRPTMKRALSAMWVKVAEAQDHRTLAIWDATGQAYRSGESAGEERNKHVVEKMQKLLLWAIWYGGAVTTTMLAVVAGILWRAW